MSSDLEDRNEANDWKNTNSHEGELVIAYDTNAGNNRLRPRIFYELYMGPNDDGNVNLIYKLSTDQTLLTMKYQAVPVPKDLIKVMNKTDASNNKIHMNHFDRNHSIVQDNHSNNNNNNGCTHFNNENNSIDVHYDELDSSQQLNDMDSNKIVYQEN